MSFKHISLIQARFRAKRAANMTTRVLLAALPQSKGEEIAETIIYHGHKAVIEWAVKIELQHGAIQQHLAELTKQALAESQALRPTP